MILIVLFVLFQLTFSRSFSKLEGLPDWLSQDRVIELQTQSSWLDGRTADGTVGLAPSTESPYTGTQWKVHVVNGDDRIIRLETLGNIDGPRWLDGGIDDGTVKLASSTEGMGTQKGTGTQWKVHVVDGSDDQIINLETLGSTNDRKWLDGRTGNGTVGLAPSTGGVHRGTHWRVSLRPKR